MDESGYYRDQKEVQEAAILIWKHRNAESAVKGQAMLHQAAVDGDSDAMGLLGLSYLSAPWVWSSSKLTVNEDEADRWLQKSLADASVIGLIGILARRELLPTELEYYLDYFAADVDEAEHLASIVDMDEDGEYIKDIAYFLLGLACLRGSIDLLLGSRRTEKQRELLAQPYLERSLSHGMALGYDCSCQKRKDVGFFQDLVRAFITVQKPKSAAAWQLKLYLQNDMIVFDHYDEAELQAALALLAETYRVIELCHEQEYISVRLVDEDYELHAVMKGKCGLRKEEDSDTVLQLLQMWMQGKIDFLQHRWQTDAQAVRLVKWQQYLDRAEICAGYGDEAGMIDIWKQAAELGCSQAMLKLGKYAKEHGAIKSAAEWFRKAAQAKCQKEAAEGWYFLGCLQMEGELKDEVQAIHNLSKAADMGAALAWAKLGHCYKHGMGAYPDKAKSLACYKKGAEMGDYEAIYALAFNCRADDGTWLDIKRAMGYLHRVVSEENNWQNPARVLMAQAFLAQHPGKYVHRAKELLQIAAQDTGMLELADCYKEEGQMDRYRLALEARAMCS